jgi:AcrR family transcriptional regulator
MVAKGTPRSLREHLRHETSELILGAAELVIARHGIGGASMQVLAREAGVAVGTLYNYFGDRDALFRELIFRHRRQLSEAIESARFRTRKHGFESQAQAFVQAVIEVFDSRRGFVRAALDSELWRAFGGTTNADGASARVRHQIENRARELAKLGVGEGLLKRDAPERLVAFLSGAVRGVLLMRARADTGLSAAEEAAAVIALFVRGAALRGMAQRGSRPGARRVGPGRVGQRNGKVQHDGC